MIMLLGMSACQQSPDSSIVVNKDLDNMIDQAQNSENGSANVAEAAGNYDTYQTTLQDENLGVNINVDARVDIPEVDQMSVFRVAQAPITQELLDRVKKELVQGATLYDGAVLDVQTKGDVEREVQAGQEYYSQIENGSASVADKNQALNEVQEGIDSLQEEYETAPNSINEVTGSYPSDGQIHTVKDLYDADPNSDFYSWEYGLNPEGEVYYGVSDGQNGQWTALFVQNNPERGNCLRFRTCKSGVEGITYAVSCVTDLEAANKGMEVVWTSPSIWKAEEEETIPAYIEREYSGAAELVRTADADVTISMEEAVQMAENFLERVGIEGYQYYNGGLYYEVLELQTKEDLDGSGYRKEYILSFMRNIDGGFVTYDNAIKESYETNGENFRKRDWSQETIEFRINDDGIIGFDYNAPLEVVETVVEQSNLKSFDEIRSTFETMATIVNADSNYETSNHKDLEVVNIEVDRVILGYALVSEPDSFDTGLLVPVWDFKGTRTQYMGDYLGYQSSYYGIMTINAIDGTVIDRELGY